MMNDDADPRFPFRRAGISRDSLHKRRATGGKQKPWRKKRKYVLHSDAFEFPGSSIASAWVSSWETNHEGGRSR
jgi:ribosomal protein S8E